MVEINIEEIRPACERCGSNNTTFVEVDCGVAWFNCEECNYDTSVVVDDKGKAIKDDGMEGGFKDERLRAADC
jgi:transposase-like protein